jgi:hypothetical protein
LVEVAAQFDISESDLEEYRRSTDAAVDEAVSALLKAYGVKHTA